MFAVQILSVDFCTFLNSIVYGNYLETLKKGKSKNWNSNISLKLFKFF
jgi:hypothetical protein